MKLIVDAGGTKTEWAIVNSDSAVQIKTCTGVNALLYDVDTMKSTFADALCDVDTSDLTEIYYYGAGCATETVCNKVMQALPKAPVVQVNSDLLGAARALFGSRKGLAGIMGTGSNTGLYDGTNIIKNMPPLGFILGDEGSGAAMGRELLRKVYRFGLLRNEFEQWLKADYGEVLRKVYREPGANQFLGSLTRFVSEHRRECQEVISNTFTPLFVHIKEYYGLEEVGFVGGLADTFSSEICEIAGLHGITVTKILKRPIPGLIEYHT
ncbi:MAG: ATPase [Bacteroidales bacterium]|nr:ATPase [Bacteroidales bacterium]